MYKYYFIFILPGTSIINIIFILLSNKYKFLNILYGHMIEVFFNVTHFDCTLYMFQNCIITKHWTVGNKYHQHKFIYSVNN